MSHDKSPVLLSKFKMQRRKYLLRCKKRLEIYLFPSRLYCRYWNCTNSAYAHGLYRRSGITPCPKDIFFIYLSPVSRYFMAITGTRTSYTAFWKKARKSFENWINLWVDCCRFAGRENGQISLTNIDLSHTVGLAGFILGKELLISAVRKFLRGIVLYCSGYSFFGE